MHKKFEMNQTKIKCSYQSGKKVVTHNSKTDLPLGTFDNDNQRSPKLPDNMKSVALVPFVNYKFSNLLEHLSTCPSSERLTSCLNMSEIAAIRSVLQLSFSFQLAFGTQCSVSYVLLLYFSIWKVTFHCQTLGQRQWNIDYCLIFSFLQPTFKSDGNDYSNDSDYSDNSNKSDWKSTLR